MRLVPDRWAERAVLAALDSLRHGTLILESEGGLRTFGSGTPGGVLRIHDRRFYSRVLAGGEIGLGESFVEGEWSTPDLVGLVALMLANRHSLAALPAAPGWLSRLRDRCLHRWRDNTRAGSRGNIRRHYDLGNRFFELFLDANLLYSCALFEDPDESLEQAQVNKLRLICDKLQLGPGDRVLEIGTGWGGFALYAATRRGAPPLSPSTLSSINCHEVFHASLAFRLLICRPLLRTDRGGRRRLPCLHRPRHSRCSG